MANSWTSSVAVAASSSASKRMQSDRPTHTSASWSPSFPRATPYSPSSLMSSKWWDTFSTPLGWQAEQTASGSHHLPPSASPAPASSLRGQRLGPSSNTSDVVPRDTVVPSGNAELSSTPKAAARRARPRTHRSNQRGSLGCSDSSAGVVPRSGASRSTGTCALPELTNPTCRLWACSARPLVRGDADTPRKDSSETRQCSGSPSGCLEPRANQRRSTISTGAASGLAEVSRSSQMLATTQNRSGR
mmetsp:Transcript_22579/g.85571  ORF Transcript_22579/g.85571 Transcript_22579/m.85571 type:complete len:246 (+) Transcript_22579:3087-3824(+)